MNILICITPLRCCCNHYRCFWCHYWKLVMFTKNISSFSILWAFNPSENAFDTCLVLCLLFLDVFIPARFKISKIHLQ